MRPGHKYSGRLQESFKADTKFHVVLKAVQQGELINKDCAQSKALGSHQAFGGNLSMPIKDAFEMFMKIFHREGTEFVKDASDFHTIIRVGIVSILGRHQQTIRHTTVLMQ